MRFEKFDTVVIGGGQAGLAAGYYLARQKRDFVIMDANARVGDSWRKRWDSLRLFTPASLDQLPGTPFPASRGYFPTKDEMAEYLEAYVTRFQLPVVLGTWVNELVREDDRYLVTAGALRLEANHVVVATGAYPTLRVPKFANELDPTITQVRSVEYRRPSQLHDGPVLVVGAGNSGAEIARDLSATHPTWLAGPDTGFVPGTYGSLGYRVGYGIVFTMMKLFTVDTPWGRSVVQKARAFTGGHPLVRVKPKDLLAAGVKRVPRLVGVRGGQPVLEDGRVLNVANIVWATGFVRDYRWIRLPIFDERGDPIHHRGVVLNEPGLYFTGLPFQSSLLSGHVAGAGDDAKHIVKQITARATDLARGEKADKLRRRASSTN